MLALKLHRSLKARFGSRQIRCMVLDCLRLGSRRISALSLRVPIPWHVPAAWHLQMRAPS